MDIARFRRPALAIALLAACGPASEPENVQETALSLAASLSPLPRTTWVATASVGSNPGNALDGNSATRWTSGTPQVDGQWFEVDMQSPQTFSQITLDAAGSTGDYPRGYQVFVSVDGKAFGNAIASGAGTTQLVTVTFPAQTARYIKVVQTGSAGNWWSIAEFNAYASAASQPLPPSSLVVSQSSSTSLALDWTASPTPGASYTIYRGTTQAFTPSAGNVVGSGLPLTRYADIGLATNTVYYYYVAATLSGQTSAVSNEASATDSLAETTRIQTLLDGDTDGNVGFYLKSAGGPVLAELNQTFVYDPASSIKILAAVELLRLVDAGRFTLSTTATYFETGPASCPTQQAPSEPETLATLLDWMLENSDDSATRTIIDLVGGFSVLDDLALSLGMTSTSYVGYPGCTIQNTLTAQDAGVLYEALAEGAILSDGSRAALFAAMATDAGDFTTTLSAADSIVQAEAAAFGLSANEIALFQAQLDLHYKAGSDDYCTGTSCAYYYSISGIAVIPTCSGSSPSTSTYEWGLFIDGATNATNVSNAFFSTDAEPLREPIRAALSTWAACAGSATPVQINAGGPAVAPYVADRDFTGGTTIDHADTIALQFGLIDPAPTPAYQSARIGNFSYTIPGFVPGSRHMVRLHFAETYFSTTGSRIFDVSLNGQPVLTSFDVVAIAGEKDTAVVSQLAANAGAGGDYLIQFTSLVNNSLVSAIEVW